jgi:hypothetical protein
MRPRYDRRSHGRSGRSPRRAVAEALPDGELALIEDALVSAAETALR